MDGITNNITAIWRTVVRDALGIFSGQGFALGISLAASVLTARYLGPEHFGVIILAQTFAFVIDRLVNSQSWEALISFGSKCKTNKELEHIKKFCWQIDTITAAIGCVLAFVLWVNSAQYFGFSPAVIAMSSIYPLVILFNITGAATGFLRLKHKFIPLALLSVITGLIKLFVALYGIFLNKDIHFFIIGWVLADITSYLFLIIYSFFEMKKEDINPFAGRSFTETIKNYPNIMRFTIFSNLHSSTGLICKEIDLLVIGLFLGSGSTGIFKIAKQFASLVAKPLDPLPLVLYPKLSQFIAEEKIQLFKSLVRRSCLACMSIGVTLWLFLYYFGDVLIDKILGEGFVGVYNVLIVYSIGSVFAIIATPIQSVLLCTGFQEPSFILLLFTSILYLILLYFFLSSFGLVGAGIAYAIFFCIHAIGMYILAFHGYKTLRA